MVVAHGKGRRLQAKAPVLIAVAALLLFGAIVLIQGECVQEDAFISFRYAANLVDGHGLTWNPGERVEGITNFLWTVMIAGVLSLGADPVAAVRVMGLLSALALFALVWRAAGRFRSGGRWTGPIALLLLASTPGFAAETAQGLETIWFALLLTLAVTIVMDALAMPDTRRRTLRFAGVGLLLALAALTRPEGVGVLGLIVMGSLAASRRGGAAGRPLLVTVVVFLAVYAPYWWLRFDYYGYPLPNTFYAKTGGGLHHLLRGLIYLGRFMVSHPVLTVLSLAAIRGLRSTWIGRRRPERVVPFVVTVGYLAYVALVGGDFKATWRFILPVLPLWALMVGAWADGRLVGLEKVKSSPGRAKIVWALLIVAVLNMAPTLYGTLRWSRHRARDLVHRTICGEWLRDNAPPGAVMAIHSAGIIPYVSGLYSIDMWGLNDLHIAHRRMPGMGHTRPSGHEKVDYDYVLSRKPDYIMPRGWALVTHGPYPGLKKAVFDEFNGVTDTENAYVARHAPMSPDKDGRMRWFNYIARRD